MSDHIILLHGLWMRGFALGLLHKRMAEAGFEVHSFDYMSVVATQERIVERLLVHMQRHAPEAVHLVGHSLGGLLALQACREAGELPPGRIVCLGSPLKGSAAARGFAGFGQGGEALLGHNRELLEHGLEHWDGPREVGMIAGRVPIGLGAMLAHMEGEHDGTVAVAETQLQGLADHCVVETSHTGLLLSAEAARQAGHFLREGRFERPAG
ncbi:MAG: alpha/beta fold hydrolase [Frateuria sp.]|uniref:esterase/lipase family protein n=1 Tax=Frateuria sp. TaxID=2211372 RepID=UPI0018174A7A|nr:alpha/beta fold hydrolase [Frateuria sp.]NUO73754.1 alpha/beta fold hydrolase [Frateuria sp.]NUR23508.1 alpha/beta fold hydrolase [Frateuria sp.]